MDFKIPDRIRPIPCGISFKLYHQHLQAVHYVNVMGKFYLEGQVQHRVPMFNLLTNTHPL